jgi:hypothetical protein
VLYEGYDILFTLCGAHASSFLIITNISVVHASLYVIITGCQEVFTSKNPHFAKEQVLNQGG